MNIEHQKHEDPKGKHPCDSSSSEDSDEEDEDYMVEEEEEEDEEYDLVEREDGENEENERTTIIRKKKESRSRGRHMEEDDDDDKEEYKEVKEEEKEEEEEERTEKVSCSDHRHVEEEKETEKAPHSRCKFLEEEDDEQEEEENQRAIILNKKASRSKCRFTEEEEDDEEEERDEETEEQEEEEEKENESAGTFKKKAPCSKAGCKRATFCKVRDYHDPYGTDIFRSGCTTQPKNPYLVAKIRANRRDQVHVPIDVVRDYKLELPSSMTICDVSGRKYETKLKIWKDGRIWLHGGWRKLCRWNLVKKNDRCICEFVRGKGKKGLYLQVQVIYEGASSHANKEE